MLTAFQDVQVPPGRLLDSYIANDVLVLSVFPLNTHNNYTCKLDTNMTFKDNLTRLSFLYLYKLYFCIR